MISQILEDHPIIKNVIRDISQMSHNSASNAVLRINSELIVRYPELFSDPDLYMVAPVMQLLDGTVVEAKSRRLKTQWDGSDERDPYSDEVLSDLVDAIYAEIKSFLAENPGVRFCPYMPVLSTGFMLDFNTHEPAASFMTRFGEAPPAKPVRKPIDELDEHPIIKNVREYTERLTKLLPSYEKTAEFIIHVNKTLLLNYPELFENSNRFMTASVTNFYDVPNPIYVETKRFSTRYGADSEAVDFGLDVEHVVMELAAEIKSIFKEYAGSEYCPFIPVTTSGPMLDSTTFEQVINFMTRFGHVPPKLVGPDHPLMINAKKSLGDIPMAKGMLMFNSILISRHPDLFGDDSRYMTEPEMVVRDERGKKTITASLLKLRTKWGLNDATGNEAEQALLKHYADAIADEIRDYLRLNSSARFCPFIPVLCKGVKIDPTTFEPIVEFTTQFALWR